MKKYLIFQSKVVMLAVWCMSILSPLSTYGQWQDFQNRLDDPSVPAFVKAMSAPRANVGEVTRLYEEYERTVIAPLRAAHELNPATAGKKFRNRYQKMYQIWRSQTISDITADGYVDYSPEAVMERLETINRIHPKNQAADRGGETWTPIGPMKVLKDNGNIPISWQANIFDLAMESGFPTIYAASELGGLFKSDNNGVEWYQVGSDQPFRNVQAVAFWPSNPNYVRIGIPGKLMYSDDGGITWAACAIDANGMTVSPNFQTFQIFLSSQGGQRAYAATSDGLLISEDYGKSWKKKFLGNASKVTSIAEHPTNPAIIYILGYFPDSKMSYISKSTNFGSTWELMNGAGWFEIPANDQGKLNVYSGRIAVTPAAPETVYVMLNETDSADSTNLKMDGFIGIYRSVNGGSTWTRRTAYLGRPYNLTDRPNLASWGANVFGNDFSYNQVWYLNNALAVSTIDADHLYASGLSMWESTDGGATWNVKGGYGTSVQNIHPDIRRIKFRKTSATTEELFWCSDGGVNYSPNGSLASHEARNNGLFAHESMGFDLDKRLELMGGGSNHNGNNFATGNYSSGIWKHEGGAETATGYVQYGTTPKIWFTEYAPFANIPPNAQSGSVTKVNSILDKAEWRPNPAIDYTDYSRAGRIIFDHQNSQKLYWGSKGKFCVSDDDGQTARVLYNFGDDFLVQWIEQSVGDKNVMYAKVEKKGASIWWLYRSDDGGASWEQLIQEEKNFVFTIQGDLKVYTAYKGLNTGDKVFYSPNGGQAFINITTTTLNELGIQTILAVEGLDNNLFVATQNGGVFNYLTSASQWINISTGLNPGAFPTQLKYFYPANGLVLATKGMGVWFLSLKDVATTTSVQMEFSSDFSRRTCLNEPVHFFNRSSNSEDSDYTWLFPDGTPGTSTDENPAVTYGTPGTYPVTLVLHDNESGLNGSLTKIAYITVSGSTSFPFAEGFENGFNPQWSLYDGNQNSNTWQITNDAGGFGNSPNSLKLNNFDFDEAGSKDEFQTLKISLLNAASAALHFDVAYTHYPEPDTKDTLAVFISTDCGKTFSQIFLSGGESLATAPASGVAFVPTANEWQQKQINLAPFLGHDEVLFKFQNRGHYGNNLYIDNINISGTLVGTEEQIVEQSLLVSPNPNAGYFRVQFDLPQNMQGALVLTDPLGREVYSTIIHGAGGTKFEQQIQLENLTSGLYLLRVQGKSVNISHKILIQR
ncbi:MAG: PKD domain-containing protein [Saprospiraceae bacterium]|nr:PKD domain-containing protein [Saprospiraceae bacterium]